MFGEALSPRRFDRDSAKSGECKHTLGKGGFCGVVLCAGPTLGKVIHIMAACKRCGAETQLYSSGVPVCIPCSDGAAAKATPTPSDVQLSPPHVHDGSVSGDLDG